MLEESRTIWVITELVSSKDVASGDGAREGKDIGGRLKAPYSSEVFATTRVAIPLETLKEEMTKFLSELGELFGQAEQQLEQQQTAMQLDEIQLSIEINGEGQISLFGVGGKTGGKGAIALKFKRKESS